MITCALVGWPGGGYRDRTDDPQRSMLYQPTSQSFMDIKAYVAASTPRDSHLVLGNMGAVPHRLSRPLGESLGVVGF